MSVPNSASHYALLSVYIGENRRSELIFQRRESALVGLSALSKFDINFLNIYPLLIETSVYILALYRCIVIQVISKLRVPC